MVSDRSDAVGHAASRWRRRLYCVLGACILIGAMDPLIPSAAAKLPPLRDSALVSLRYTRLNPQSLGTPDTSRIFLVGSSVVRGNLDEGLMNEVLAPQKAHVCNFGIDGSYCLTMVALADYLKQFRPSVVMMGLSDVAVGATLTDEYAHVWDEPVTREIGCQALYDRVPGLPARYRVRCQDFMLRHWNLYAYRQYFRHHLMGFAKAAMKGPAAVYGPYRSPQHPPNPDKLKAAMRAPKAELSEAQLAECTELVEESLPAVQEILSDAGCRLVIVWLPQPLDPVQSDSNEKQIVRSICTRRGIPLLDISGSVPVSGFIDNVHASRDGKRMTTEALLARMQAMDLVGEALNPNPSPLGH